MNLVSMRIITSDLNRLVSFYELISGMAVTRYTEDFAELPTPSCTLAIGNSHTLRLFGAEDVLSPAQNRSAIIEFLVEDVDKEFARLRERVTDVVQEPTTMPWGNRSLLVRDPDGNLINLFTPVTPNAINKFKQNVRSAVQQGSGATNADLFLRLVTGTWFHLQPCVHEKGHHTSGEAEIQG